MKSGYTGLYVRISDEDLLDCLQLCAFSKRELGGIIAEKSLCSAGRLVAPAADAAGMSRFVGSLFDAMGKFLAEAGSIASFMIDGDVNGSWRPAPAQLFTRILLHALLGLGMESF